MPTLAEYLERKNAELAWLAARAGEPHIAAISPFEVVERKLVLRGALLAAVARGRIDLTETWCRPGAPSAIGSWQLRWLYQRYDMEIAAPTLFPRLEAVPAIRTTRFATSCMGAITGFVLALDGSAPQGSTVVVPTDAYFETLQLLEHVPRRVRTALVEPAEVVDAVRRARPLGLVTLVVDSIARVDPLPALEALRPGEVDVLLFDTTLYPAGDPRLVAMLTLATRLGALAVFVRSHQKLDFLGVEYGRLGSIQFVAEPAGSKRAHTLHRTLSFLATHLIRVTGLGPLPLHLVPFADDPVFLAFNEARLDQMGNNNARVAHELARRLPDHTVTAHHHGRFVTLDAGPEATGSREEVEAALGALGDVCAARGVPAWRANSFGFDFTSLSGSSDAARRHRVVRLSVADHPDDVVDATLEAVCEWALSPRGA